MNHLDSCDLDDDDLMLDADDSEDSSLFSGTKPAKISSHSQIVIAESGTRLFHVWVHETVGYFMHWVLKLADSSDWFSLCGFDLPAFVSPVQMEAGHITWLSGRGGSCAGECRSLTTTVRGDVICCHVLVPSC